MTKEEIDDVICEIMYTDGPDAHIDGHGVITDFIISLLNGKEEEWKSIYWKEKNISDGIKF